MESTSWRDSSPLMHLRSLRLWPKAAAAPSNGSGALSPTPRSTIPLTDNPVGWLPSWEKLLQYRPSHGPATGGGKGATTLARSSSARRNPLGRLPQALLDRVGQGHDSKGNGNAKGRGQNPFVSHQQQSGVAAIKQHDCGRQCCKHQGTVAFLGGNHDCDHACSDGRHLQRQAARQGEG